MTKARTIIGGTFGSLIGFIIGMLIPSGEDVALSFFSRITGNVILQDPIGFVISAVYVMLAVAICGAIGTVVGNLFSN